MSLQLTAPPVIEPVSLDEAKAHLKVDTTDEDALIARAIAGARARAEWHTGRAFVTQGWMLWLDCWPCTGAVEIPLPPLQAVTSITVYATDGTPTVLDPSTYQVDIASSPGRVLLSGCSVAPMDLRTMNALAIAFTAGYGDDADDVPTQIREAILDYVADLYANRGDSDDANANTAAQALLAPVPDFEDLAPHFTSPNAGRSLTMSKAKR